VDPIGPQLLLQAILILLNAFFAGTEMAVVSLNENLLRRDAEDGDKKAQRLLKITQAPTQFLSTIQIGITLAGFLGSAFAADNFATRITVWLVEGQGVTALSAKTIQTLAVVIVTIILSFFTLVFGELVPKRIAMKKAEQVARLASGIVNVLAVVMKPVIWLLSMVTNGVLRLCGIDPHAQDEEVSEDEIRMMVDMGEEAGTIESNERELIDNIFEFNNMTAEDIMVHRKDMFIIWMDDSDEEIIGMIRESGMSRFPVCGDDVDDVVGLLNTRDYLLNAQLEQPKPLRELLRKAYFVPETVAADVLFRDMQKQKVHMAIVVDEYGGTSGLVTMEDLLEQLVGDIYDEFDTEEEQEIVQLEENLWKISGSAQLEDVGEALGIEFDEDDEYDTLGGLVFDHLSVIPEDGSMPQVDALGLHIKVTLLQERRVEWAEVSKLPQTAETEEN